jgi:hypothetical protein
MSWCGVMCCAVHGQPHVAVASARWSSVVCVLCNASVGGEVVSSSSTQLDSSGLVWSGPLPSQHMPGGASSDRPALHSVDALRCTARRGRSFAYLPACLVYLPVYLPVACMLAGHRVVLALLCVSSSARAARYVHGLVYSLPHDAVIHGCEKHVTMLCPHIRYFPVPSLQDPSSLHRSTEVAGVVAARAGAERHCQTGRAVVGAVRRLTAASLTGTGLGI